MLQLTKIFRFEMAHAIHNYNGPCSNIHGLSYKLYVTVAAVNNFTRFIPSQGFIVDFKELKSVVTESFIRHFDHKLVLSRHFLDGLGFMPWENTIIWDYEPTAENLILYIQKEVASALPPTIQLIKLKLYETKDSSVTWFSSGNI